MVDNQIYNMLVESEMSMIMNLKQVAVWLSQQLSTKTYESINFVFDKRVMSISFNNLPSHNFTLTQISTAKNNNSRIHIFS